MNRNLHNKYSHFDTVEVCTSVGFQIGFVSGYSRLNGVITTIDLIGGCSYLSRDVMPKKQKRFFRCINNILSITTTKMVLVEKTIKKQEFKNTDEENGYNAYTYSRYIEAAESSTFNRYLYYE